MIKFTGDLRCDFEKATAEIVKLKDRILGYQQQISSLRSSVMNLEKSKEADNKHFKETIDEKDAIIKELQNRLVLLMHPTIAMIKPIAPIPQEI